MAYLLFFLTLIAVSVSMFNHWNLSKGRLNKVYPGIIVACSLYIIIETILALRDPVQSSVLLFHITNVWAIIMAIKGWAKIKDLKEKENGNDCKENKH